MKKRYFIIVLLIIFNVFGCTENIDNSDGINEKNEVKKIIKVELIEEKEEEIIEKEIIEEEIIEEEIIEEEIIEEEIIIIEEEVDIDALYSKNNVNELGQIIVIMYHNLSENPGEYSITKELFIKDLERLYSEGYRTISMTDLVNGNIDIPIGTTPVVLTFDDGSKSHFYYEENGVIAKDSVVSILDEFSKTHKDFGNNAIFYLYGENPFRESDKIKEKYEYLINNGYEIGNHTYEHLNLSELDVSSIQYEIAKQQIFTSKYIDYKLKHISIPYGQKPPAELFEYLFKGSYNDVTYENISAVNVGWNPISSPYSVKFNPKSINRITCGDDDYELNFWLDYFVNNPNKKYISDGNPNTITISNEQLDEVKNIYKENIFIYSKTT